MTNEEVAEGRREGRRRREKEVVFEGVMKGGIVCKALTI